MRDVDRRAAELAVYAPNLRARFDAELGVEIRQWLVHQHKRRLDDDRARDRHALLLTTGKLAGELVFLSRQLHELQRMLDARSDLATGHTLHPQAEGDIPPDGHMGEQRVVLKHHAESTLLRRERIDPQFVQLNGPARQRQEACDAIESG